MASASFGLFLFQIVVRAPMERKPRDWPKDTPYTAAPIYETSDTLRRSVYAKLTDGKPYPADQSDNLKCYYGLLEGGLGTPKAAAQGLCKVNGFIENAIRLPIWRVRNVGLSQEEIEALGDALERYSELYDREGVYDPDEVQAQMAAYQWLSPATAEAVPPSCMFKGLDALTAEMRHLRRVRSQRQYQEDKERRERNDLRKEKVDLQTRLNEIHLEEERKARVAAEEAAEEERRRRVAAEEAAERAKREPPSVIYIRPEPPPAQPPPVFNGGGMKRVVPPANTDTPLQQAARAPHDPDLATRMITLPRAIDDRLVQTAAAAGQSPEDWIAALVAQHV